MRIIAGIYKGRHLKSPPSLEVRPTSDRLRETLFNILAPQIDGVRFLDLCAGSGAVGIEALSRGAAHATFVDRSRKMCGLIEANLDMCRVPENETEIFNSDAADFLRHALTRKLTSWDMVFFDPPYKEDYIGVLELLGRNTSELLAEGGLIVVEHHHKNRLPGIVADIEQMRVVKQGDSSLTFYRIQEGE
jgi:16S rRNA (guanine(966)-N(2))-methyltransferase RsmD